MLAMARLQVSFVLHKSSWLGLISNGSKQGDKSAQHSKLVRNVAGQIFPCGFAPLTKIPCSFYAHLGWVVALLPKKYPRQQNPTSYIGYTKEFLYELPGPTVGHLHLFLKNWQLPDNCPAGGMSMLAIDWVVIQLDYKISSPSFFFRDSRASEMQARENHPTRQKATPDRESKKWGSLIFLSPRRVLPFLAWGDFHACLRFARSTIPEQK